MAKRILSLILAVLTVFSLCVPAFAEEAEAVLTDEEVQELIDAGEAFEVEGTPEIETAPEAEESPEIGETPDAEEAPSAEDEPAIEEPPVVEETPQPADEPEAASDVAPAAAAEAVAVASDVVGSGSCGTNVTWSLTSDGTLTISGSGKMASDTWRGDVSQAITSAGGNASTYIKKVVIQSGVTSISDEAFSENEGLTSVSISNTVTSIGAYAFASCYNLESVNIPDSVTSIGAYAFEVTGIKSITIPGSVKVIPTGAFYGSNLTSVTISEGVITVGAYAFYLCRTTSVTVPKSVTQMNDSAFAMSTDMSHSITILNPDCKIADSAMGGSANKGAITISGYEGSTAQTIAKKYGYTFKNMNLATPKVSSVANTATGVKITWGKVTGAAKYRVFYKTGSGGWTKIADTTDTSCTWSGGKNGVTYTFTVRCISSDGKSYASAYDAVGKSITCYTCVNPKISTVANTATGVKISWGKVTGAAKYRVFYKTGSGSWKKIADTTSTSYTWTKAVSGSKYTFTVRCVNSAGSAYTSAYDTTGKSITFVAVPKVSSVSNTANGVKISWSKVAGAGKYRVYYKTGSGSWKKLTDTTATSYTWTGAKSGTKYSFTLRCMDSAGKNFVSSYDNTGKSITYVAAPKISAVSNTATGVKISWGKVTGAAKYRVFYKTSSGWKKIADTTSTSYTWTKAASGTKYTFTVRCVNSAASAYTSGYDTTGKSITYVAAPKITDISVSASGGVKITWGKSAGAAKYRLYYKTGSGSWTKLTDTTATSYTWTGAKSGTKYSFTLRCMDSNGSFVSSYDSTGKTLTYAAAPKVSAVSNTASGVKITWGKVTGAEKYRVFYKTGSGSWTKIADTASTSYVWSGAKKGVTYTFTVRCISSDGKTYVSGYDTTGVSITSTYNPNAVNEVVPMTKLSRYSYFQQYMTDAQLQQAYNAALEIVTPLVGLSREEQLYGIASTLREMVDSGMVDYSQTTAHYNDPYGYLVLKVASCAGCVRTTGLCLDMLGISYEHVHENKWCHQWARVKVGSVYWICDAFGLCCGPEPAPYQHPILD